MLMEAQVIEVRDMKAGLGKKPPLAHVPPALLAYAARAHEYGAEKYRLGNFLRQAPEGMTDIERLLGYISATQRHLADWADSIIRHMGDGVGSKPTLAEAVYAEDWDDAKGEGSHLPAASHVVASAGMAIQQAVDCGLLPKDPKDGPVAVAVDPVEVPF